MSVGAQPSEMQEARPVTLRVVSVNGIVTDLAVRSPGNDRTRIIARSSSIGQPIEALAINGSVDFYRFPRVAPTNSPGSAEREEPVVARIDVRNGGDEFLVLISAVGRGEQRKFGIFATSFADRSLGPGQTLALNFTEWPLAVRMGEDISRIGPGQSQVLFWPPSSDGHLNVQIARSIDEAQWELVTSTRISIPSERRLFILLMPGAQAESDASEPVIAVGAPIEFRVIYDRPTPQD
ncbi:hypothetical protein H5P30_21725 [Puniceicoccus vermicola]|uniref:Uncharacterized protein n=2 Tax=Puniceicoccus vermicola TaxID=388746 RepID=A0A7X1B2F5_9BACT|nr:hypothetical protein [Puniceicoccus vermicola]